MKENKSEGKNLIEGKLYGLRKNVADPSDYQRFSGSQFFLHPVFRISFTQIVLKEQIVTSHILCLELKFLQHSPRQNHRICVPINYINKNGIHF